MGEKQSAQNIEGPLVFDTSALFNFGHRGRMEQLFDRLERRADLLIPEAVVHEAIEQEVNRRYYENLIKTRFQRRIGEVPAGYDEKIGQLSRVLGTGELEVIMLALETKATAVIDEPEARAAARQLGLRVIGTLGILLIAVKERWMSEQEALAAIEKIRTGGFRIPAVQSGQTLQQYVQSLSEEKESDL